MPLARDEQRIIFRYPKHFPTQLLFAVNRVIQKRYKRIRNCSCVGIFDRGPVEEEPRIARAVEVATLRPVEDAPDLSIGNDRKMRRCNRIRFRGGAKKNDIAILNIKAGRKLACQAARVPC